MTRDQKQIRREPDEYRDWYERLKGQGIYRAKAVSAHLSQLCKEVDGAQSMIDTAFRHVPASQVVEFFNRPVKELRALRNPFEFALLIASRYLPAFDSRDYKRLLAAFLRHLQHNAPTLIAVGYGAKVFKQSMWLDLLLNKVYFVKDLCRPPCNRDALCWRGTQSEGHLPILTTYEQADYIKYLDAEEAKRLENCRRELVNLCRSICVYLCTSIERGCMWEEVIYDCSRILAGLGADLVSFLERIDTVYRERVLIPYWHRARAGDQPSWGGYTDLADVASHVALELAVGFYSERMKPLLSGLSKKGCLGASCDLADFYADPAPFKRASQVYYDHADWYKYQVLELRSELLQSARELAANGRSPVELKPPQPPIPAKRLRLLCDSRTAVFESRSYPMGVQPFEVLRTLAQNSLREQPAMPKTTIYRQCQFDCKSDSPKKLFIKSGPAAERFWNLGLIEMVNRGCYRLGLPADQIEIV